MKVATAIVGTDDMRFRRVTANPERLALATRIANFVEREGVHICAMPAGYLAAPTRTRAAVDATADNLARVFSRVDLIAGIDVDRSATRTKHRESAKAVAPADSWPFWAFTSRRGKVDDIHQQRTVHPGERTYDTSARLATVGGGRVALLICGEVYNPALSEALGRERPNLVVDVGHKSMGRHFTATLRNAAAAAGCRVLHAQHVALRSRGASKWTGTPQRAWAVTKSHWASHADESHRDALWAEVVIWTIEQ